MKAIKIILAILLIIFFAALLIAGLFVAGFSILFKCFVVTIPCMIVAAAALFFFSKCIEILLQIIFS